jgi:enoyl-CoA hydratase/carnithine racemase
MQGSTIRVHHADGIVTVAIDRPPANALDTATLVRLADELATLDACGTRALVLTGGGDRFFSAGGDVKELVTLDEAGGIDRIDAFNRVLELLDRMPWPVACAVNGTAVGGGTELILFCDFAVGVRDERFGLPEINHGLLPSAVSVGRAIRRLGEPAARRLLLSGELIPASTAAELRLIDEVADTPEDARAAADAWARAMAAKPPVLVAALKDLLRGADRDETALAEVTASQFAAYFGDPATVAARDDVIARWRAAS